MILLYCTACAQRYWAGTAYDVLCRLCLCGGDLRCVLHAAPEMIDG